MALPANSLLDDGREAVARGGYAEARRLFDAAAADRCAEAYEGLARCAHHDADYRGAVANYEHAYAAYQNRQDDRSARRVALAIAYLGAVYGEDAVMTGWVARSSGSTSMTPCSPWRGGFGRISISAPATPRTCRSPFITTDGRLDAPIECHIVTAMKR